MQNERKQFDLEDRLVDFAAGIVDVVRVVPTDRAGNHIAGQLIRCGTSPAANYGEAQGAESRRDFIHKLRVGYKELRETRIWLKIIVRKELSSEMGVVRAALEECEQLVRIFFTSIRTARAGQRRN